MSDEEFLTAYGENKNTVYSVILNYVRNADDASELTQDTFMKLYGYEGEFDSDEHIKAWLIRVAINGCKNFVRSRKHPPGSDVSYEPFSEDKYEFDEIVNKVMALPEKYRIPVHLFYYEEYSIPEIASILGLSEAAVKTRLKRGRDKLRESLRKEDWI
jgi:RNA polymerase sigma-70 factor (ECF subfamily)